MYEKFTWMRRREMRMKKKRRTDRSDSLFPSLGAFSCRVFVVVGREQEI